MGSWGLGRRRGGRRRQRGLPGGLLVYDDGGEAATCGGRGREDVLEYSLDLASCAKSYVWYVGME